MRYFHSDKIFESEQYTKTEVNYILSQTSDSGIIDNPFKKSCWKGSAHLLSRKIFLTSLATSVQCFTTFASLQK